jgi:arginase family enzyme
MHQCDSRCPSYEFEENLFCFAKSSFEFNKEKIIPIIIGGSQDLTFALYRSFDELEQMVNLVSIDSKFDFGKENCCSSYLTNITFAE